MFFSFTFVTIFLFSLSGDLKKMGQPIITGLARA